MKIRNEVPVYTDEEKKEIYDIIEKYFNDGKAMREKLRKFVPQHYKENGATPLYIRTAIDCYIMSKGN